LGKIIRYPPLSCHTAAPTTTLTGIRFSRQQTSLSIETHTRAKLLRRRTLEYRLFFWMLGLALVPSLLVLAAATWIGRGTLDWFGTLGPWAAVSESGRALIDAAEPAARTDSALAESVQRHREELEASLVQARRWGFLGARVISLLPFALLIFALLLSATALVISRRIAHQLSRPIQELASWTDRIAQEQPLPPPTAEEAREVREVQALRQSLRQAADELGRARVRALAAERTRAWGEMARRVAHEMKNPLTPLRLAAHRLAAGLRDPSPAIAEPLRVVEEETLRLELLAREFATLGRPAAGPRSAVDVGELIHGLLQTDVNATIDVAFNAPHALPLIDADYNALQQSFRNVLRNAVEAVIDRVNPRIAVNVVAADDAITVSIRDNGPGFEQGAQSRIFEPDYTTKPRGTGLGLTIARQAVEAHNGTMSAQQPPEGGAEVLIRLPVTRQRQHVAV
jgi:nitrogen fixation/metabolism regulation signal transduction histidine kinase